MKFHFLEMFLSKSKLLSARGSEGNWELTLEPLANNASMFAFTPQANFSFHNLSFH